MANFVVFFTRFLIKKVHNEKLNSYHPFVVEIALCSSDDLKVGKKNERKEKKQERRFVRMLIELNRANNFSLTSLILSYLLQTDSVR